MNQRDYIYYEAHAADVSLDEITSNEILQWLRDEDLESIYVGKCGFAFREGDDLGWLAYFIAEVNLYEDSRYSGPVELTKRHRLHTSYLLTHLMVIG